MAQTTILEERNDRFSPETGEITEQTHRVVKKTKIEPTDEFIKVSKYLNVIFAYNNIPLSLVPISLLIAQEMEFKTNKIYLLKPTKELFSKYLDISLDRVNKLILECRKYDIIRPIARGVFEVNSFLYSTGSVIETRNLQAHFDIEHDNYTVSGDMTSLITGQTVRKAVTTRKRDEINGQMSLFDKGLELNND